jgi:hypothetical protein
MTLLINRKCNLDCVWQPEPVRKPSDLELEAAARIEMKGAVRRPNDDLPNNAK